VTRLWRYTGATARVSLAEARRLDPRRWAVQEKHDGAFVRLHLDAAGRVRLAFTRSEREVPRAQLGAILGARIGRPHAVLVGELEAYTEAGVRAAAARGQALVHLFDCLHDGERSIDRLPYRARRDALWRAWVGADEASPGARDARGRYAKARDTALAPIVAQCPLAHLEAAWGDVVVDGGREGLVLVDLDAPAGARRAKLKAKPFETLDCRAVAVARTTVTLEWRGSLFNVGRGRLHVEQGEVVEVRHAGWYAAGQTPRFPAIVRIRRDLQ
jgi:ATP-dependent DNA ligase